MRTFTSAAELTAAQGGELGTSDWVTVTQEAVNLFADATGDHQWIHVDPERATKGPFGTTIAHGYMTLSLLPALMHTMYSVEGVKLAINTLVNVEDLGNGAVQLTVSTAVEVEGSAKPACVAESLVRYVF